jgi:hypothetical protein
MHTGPLLTDQGGPARLHRKGSHHSREEAFNGWSEGDAIVGGFNYRILWNPFSGQWAAASGRDGCIWFRDWSVGRKANRVYYKRAVSFFLPNKTDCPTKVSKYNAQRFLQIHPFLV